MPTVKARAAALLLLTLLAIPPALRAQGTPLGPEFRVNTYTTSNQVVRSRAVASDSSGNFVMVWESNIQDAGSGGIFGQRFTIAGAPLGSDFQINTYTTSTQMWSAVASDPAGNFVVAWQSFTQDGSGWGIFAQRYASTGAPLGGEFRVNTHTTNQQWHPSVTSDSAGSFIVVWEGYAPDDQLLSIRGQRYSSAGVPLGGEFRVNSNTPADQMFPSVASDSAGNFVVVWQSLVFAGGIVGQRYHVTGVPLGVEFRVNDLGLNGELPSVASGPTGNFVVAWHRDIFFPPGATSGVFARRYTSTGAPLGDPFRVNTYTIGPQKFPSAATDMAGNFVVVWESYIQDGGTRGVFGQRYASTGDPQGGEFQVNTYTTSDQRAPSVAADPNGNFVVAWSDLTQDGSGYGVFAQRFSMIVSVQLLGFRVE